jgi:hypothetical protein
VLLGLTVAIAPALALAAHQFADVPSTHIFHADIDAVADAGITGGCSATTYCPADAVTRGQMAAFLRRGGGHLTFAQFAGTESISVDSTELGSSPVEIGELAVRVPGVDNGLAPTQLIQFDGRINLNTSMATALKGCPCEFEVVVSSAALADGFFTRQTFESSANLGAVYGIDVGGVVEAPPGVHTFDVSVRLTTRWSSLNAVTFNLTSSWLAASTFPFDGAAP